MLGLLRRAARPPATAPSAPQWQGYVDERSTHHVRGWMRDVAAPTERVAYEVRLGERVLATGVADGFSDVLVKVGVGDGRHAFDVVLDPPLTESDRDALVVGVAGTEWIATLAPALNTRPPFLPAARIVGYVDERSARHVAGWLWDESEPAGRLGYQVVLDDRVIAEGVADEPSLTLERLAIGDGCHGFTATFAALAPDQVGHLSVRAATNGHVLPLAPALRVAFEPIDHVAMDIVDNCNLRCPFCVYDYTGVNRTHVMDDATFGAAIRLLPFVRDGEFWLSCLHEATLHPRLEAFIAAVPAAWRRKLMYTTNLAKRMPDAYFALLGGSGMHHLNISLESLDPAVYERLRKGARMRIFTENWDKLLRALETGAAPPELRYNLMAYRSNHRELPALIEHLLRERRGALVEVRDTFPEPHIPQSFRDAEFMSASEWAWLEAELRRFDPAIVRLLGRPQKSEDGTEVAVTAAGDAVHFVTTRPEGRAGGGVPRPFNFRIEWNGTLLVYGERKPAPGEPSRHEHYVLTNIHRIRDPFAFLTAL